MESEYELLDASPAKTWARGTGAIAEDEFAKGEENEDDKKENSVEESVSTHQATSSDKQSELSPSDPLQTMKTLVAATTASIESSILNIPSSGLDQDSIMSLLEGVRCSTIKVHSLLNTLALAAISVGDFIRFSKLPLELGRAIWKLVLPGPRVVEVSKTNDRRGIEYDTLSMNVDMSALMHVCRESRQIWVEKYSLKLANSTRLPRDCARIDPREDTVYIPDIEYLDNCVVSFKTCCFSGKALSTIRVLVIDYLNWGDFERNSIAGPFDFTAFNSLQQITIVWWEIDSEPHCECCGNEYGFLPEDITLPDLPHEDALVVARAKVEFSMQRCKEEHNKPDWKIPEIKFGRITSEKRKPRREYWGF